MQEHVVMLMITEYCGLLLMIMVCTYHTSSGSVVECSPLEQEVVGTKDDIKLVKDVFFT